MADNFLHHDDKIQTFILGAGKPSNPVGILQALLHDGGVKLLAALTAAPGPTGTPRPVDFPSSQEPAILAASAMPGHFHFCDLRELLAKANEEKSGDQLAGVAAASAGERIAAKQALAELPLIELLNSPVMAMPLLFGFSVYLTPLMIGASDAKSLDTLLRTRVLRLTARPGYAKLRTT